MAFIAIGDVSTRHHKKIYKTDNPAAFFNKSKFYIKRGWAKNQQKVIQIFIAWIFRLKCI